MNAIEQCPSCQTELRGMYCSNCGEKRVESKNFTIPHILKEGFSFLTNLDSTLYQTIKGLLFKPGFLPQEYIAGRRKMYMKPFQVFVLSSILFFIFLSEIDIFLVPSKWFFTDDLGKLINELMKKHDVSQEMLAQMYDAKIVNNSKLYIFLLLPVIALLIYMFNWKKMREFGKHLIHAIYILSFFMILTVLITEFVDVLPWMMSKWWFIIPIEIGLVVYISIFAKNVFDLPWWYAVLQGIIITVLLGFFIGVYRYGISYFTLLNL